MMHYLRPIRKKEKVFINVQSNRAMVVGSIFLSSFKFINDLCVDVVIGISIRHVGVFP